MRKQCAFIGLLAIVLAGCDLVRVEYEPPEEKDAVVVVDEEQEQEPEVRETKNVTYTGTVQPAGISVYQEGTHRLILPEGKFVLLESDTLLIDLNGYVGEEVQIFGSLRPTVEAGGMIMRVEGISLIQNDEPEEEESEEEEEEEEEEVEEKKDDDEDEDKEESSSSASSESSEEEDEDEEEEVVEEVSEESSGFQVEDAKLEKVDPETGEVDDRSYLEITQVPSTLPVGIEDSEEEESEEEEEEVEEEEVEEDENEEDEEEAEQSPEEEEEQEEEAEESEEETEEESLEPDPDFVERTEVMARQNYAAENWTQQYCTSHIGFCTPVHRNWWFKSFGATNSTLWHVEFSPEPVENLHDGPVTLELLPGAIGAGGGGAIQVINGKAFGYAEWTFGRHFRVSADESLVAAVAYMIDHITEYNQ